MQDIAIYKNAQVAKLFPLYSNEPFKGKVSKVDTSGKDDKPIHIIYEDGDREWISVEELQEILVDRELASKPVSKHPSKQAPVGGKSSSGKKRSRPSSAKTEQPAVAAAAAGADQPTTSNKKQKASSSSKSADKKQSADSTGAAAAATDKPAAVDQPFNAEREKRQLKQQNGLGGMTNFTLTAGAVRAAAGKAGIRTAAPGTSKEAAAEPAGQEPAAHAAVEKQTAPAAASGFGGVRGSPSVDTTGLLAAIHQNAKPTANRLAQDRQVMRLEYKGPGAAALPKMAQAVLVDGCVEVSLFSTRPRSSMTPGRGLAQPSSSATPIKSDHNYKAEADSLLEELDKVLKTAQTDKTHLIQVRVTLRSMRDGLPGFQEAWNAWVDRSFLPVMSLVEGAGPIASCGIMLEAKAIVPRRDITA